MRKATLVKQEATTISQETYDLLIEITDKLEISKSEFIRDAIKKHLEKVKKNIS